MVTDEGKCTKDEPAANLARKQGIAYALVANMPPEYGLYSAFMGCFIYIIFGSCKDVTVGPTAIVCLFTAPLGLLGADFAVLVAFTSGIIILALGLLRLGTY